MYALHGLGRRFVRANEQAKSNVPARDDAGDFHERPSKSVNEPSNQQPARLLKNALDILAGPDKLLRSSFV